MVRYLRKGVVLELVDALQDLEVKVAEEAINPLGYDETLARFDEARGLLSIIGLSSAAHDRDIELDPGRWHALATKALESQHTAEVCRLRDAAAEGVQLLPRDVPALGEVVAELHDKTYLQSTRGRPPRRSSYMRRRGT
jgi:hypothetical protein